MVLILRYLIKLLWRKLEMRLVLGRLEFTQKQMSTRFVQFIAFGKIQNDLLRVLQTIFEVDEMEHEVADRVEDDVLSQHFWDSHRLILFASVLAVTSFRFISAPQRPFNRFSEIIEVAHQITR